MSCAKEKKKLLFLHGYLADKNTFFYQVKFFKNYYDCYVVDLPGFGANKNMPYPYVLDDYIAFVKAYMQANGIVRPDVIAHSFGARIAVKAAALDGDLFGKLVIVGGAGLKPKRTFAYAVKKLKFSTLKIFVDKSKLSKYYSADYLALSPVMRQSFIKIVNEHLDGICKNVKNKTLLVYGKNDKETPLYMAKRYNKYIKNSSLLTLADTGHFCFLESPVKFNLSVREFLLR